MDKKMIAPNNEVSDLVSNLQKENTRFKKKILCLENDVLKAQNKYLKLEQKYLVLQAKHRSPLPPVIETDNEGLRELLKKD